jgi:hypothetical protein
MSELVMQCDVACCPVRVRRCACRSSRCATPQAVVLVTPGVKYAAGGRKIGRSVWLSRTRPSLLVDTV